MKILKTITQCRSAVGAIKEEGLTMGLVPTMGYLHEGHLSLVRTAKRQCHRVLMTIFVNPTQFGPGEDFNRYPRDLKRDAALAGENGVDYIFNPAVGEIYKKNHKTYVEIEDLTEMMCGGYRPGHFRGVATIVLKLFNIIPAQKAYFGKKDYQQLVVIKKMVRDLNLDIKIIGCPTVRERDGLALSSRNKYLKPGERENAAVIYRTLKNAEKAIKTIGGTEYGITYIDREGEETVKRIVDLLEGNSIFVKDDTKPIYHAAACIASNYLVTLIDYAVYINEKIGIEPQASTRGLLNLIEGTVQNIKKMGTKKSLTGPIARGDAGTIKDHLEMFNNILEKRDTEVYRLMGKKTADLARENEWIDNRIYKKLIDFFKD